MSYRVLFDHGPYRVGTAYRRNVSHVKKDKKENIWRRQFYRNRVSENRCRNKTKRAFLKFGHRRHRQHNRRWIMKDPERLHNRDFKYFYNPWYWD